VTDYASAMGMTLTSRPQIVMEWYRLFHHNRKFLRPPHKKDNLPPFLQQNPNVVQAMQQYGRDNLIQLSVLSTPGATQRTVIANFQFPKKKRKKFGQHEMMPIR
jgi:hypothetical protein